MQQTDDGRVQIISLLPVLAEIYATAREIPQHLNGEPLEEEFERHLMEWTHKFRATPVPRIAWHPSLIHERDAVEMLSICISALGGYQIGYMSSAAQSNLSVAIWNLDAAAKAVAIRLALIEPAFNLDQHLPDYFVEDSSPDAS